MAQIGRYTVLESVGEGGMAEVFRARLDGPMGFQKEVAIKRIRDDVVRDHGDYVRSLINEARIGGQLKHPNLVEVYELAEQDGTYYIAMEFVQGTTFQELLDQARRSKQRVPPNVALDIAIQVCRGLSHAHQFHGEGGQALHLVHRDLKPGNVMINVDGVAKVMDFGIAKATSNLFNTTDPGTAKGTPLYMSPEQLRGLRPLTAASDLWSLGVMLYEMATSRLLFRGRTVPEIITRVLNYPLGPIVERGEAAIRGLGPLLARLLERDPAARLHDAAEVARELERLLEWQDQRLTTREFLHAWREGRQEFDPLPADPLPAEEESMTPAAAEKELRESRALTPVEHRYLKDRRWGRTIFLWVGLPLVIAAGGVVGEYIWRRTIAAQTVLDAAESALGAGRLDEARALWKAALEERPSLVEARYGAVLLGSLAGEPTDEGLRSLEHAPEEIPEDFARKYAAFAWVLRQAGDMETAFRYQRLALEKARDAGVTVPPSLLWEAAETAVMLGSNGDRAVIHGTADAGRSFWKELGTVLPPGEAQDAAHAWVEALDAGREPLLRAEQLWIDGRSEEAWAAFDTAWTASPGAMPARDLPVWLYRALGDGNWALGQRLAALPPPGEAEGRQGLAVAQLVLLSATGQIEAAHRALPAVLKAAAGAEGRAKARLLVARALRREKLDPEWSAALLDEAGAELGDLNDADIRLLAAGAGTGSGPFDGPTRMAWDPRTRRLYPGALRRGGPTASHLIPGPGFNRLNRSSTGATWPFGPAWAPVGRGALPVFYHPGR